MDLGEAQLGPTRLFFFLLLTGPAQSSSSFTPIIGGSNGLGFSWEVGVFYPYTNFDTGTGLVDVMYCEQLVLLLEDANGDPIDAERVFQCGCTCEEQCTYTDVTGTQTIETACQPSFGCSDPCSYVESGTSGIFTEGGEGPLSCDVAQ